MRNTFMRSIVIFWVLAPAFAWGPEGHRIVADLARQRLNPPARRAIVQLVGDDDLASISTWADEVRPDRPETAGWHFVNIPSSATGFDEPRDCYHPKQRVPATLADHHNCIVDRITGFERVLADVHASRADRIEALKFLVHFVGDIHQPLHAIADARGGNDIHILEFGRRECGHRECDLHGTWDVGLIHHARLSQSRYVARLSDLVAREGLDSKSSGTPAQWANESFRLARAVWVRDGSYIDESYYRRNRPTLDRQLGLAGARLSRLLNEALGR